MLQTEAGVAVGAPSELGIGFSICSDFGMTFIRGRAAVELAEVAAGATKNKTKSNNHQTRSS